MENIKPKITDPKEWALIKSIYFEKDYFDREKIDPIEQLERENCKIRNLNNNSR